MVGGPCYTVFKLVVLVQRKPEISFEQFHEFWTLQFAHMLRPAALRLNVEFSYGIVLRLPASQAIVHDGMLEFWWDDEKKGLEQYPALVELVLKLLGHYVGNHTFFFLDGPTVLGELPVRSFDLLAD